MEKENSFTENLLHALEEKTQWYDNTELPALLENYRLLYSCVKTLFDFLVKKTLITPDPYKMEKKISDIVPPDNSQFIENERSTVMGLRFSDYESTLDFLCNYYKFSVGNLTIQNIKKLFDLNAAFLWNSFSVNSNKTNTRVLATIVLDARQNSDMLSISMINDSLSKASKALTDINTSLKTFSQFQKEVYKGNVRKNVLFSPSFDSEKAKASPAAEFQQIKKCFAAAMGKVPFYNELIEEITQEDLSENKEDLQKKLLDSLTVSKQESEKESKKIDTKAMLMTVVNAFGALPVQFTQIAQKIQENHDVLESEHNSFMDKLYRTLRKAFKIEEKPLFYSVAIIDPGTGAKKHEKVNYQQLLADISGKIRKYTAVAQKNSPSYKKIAAMPEEKIFEFVSSQISECNKTIVLYNALDEFFKVTVSPENKSKIKGLKIDIASLKNSIIKANQYRAEYSAYIEEEAQMKRLGIGTV